MAEPHPTSDGRTVTVRVPLTIRRRGGRKLVLAPDGTNIMVPVSHVDNAMVKAIARAFRWRDLLENGTYATIKEIAAAEKINESYVGRILRLSLLAPDIVEAILGGRQPAGMQLEGLLRRFPIGWSEQREATWEGKTLNDGRLRCDFQREGDARVRNVYVARDPCAERGLLVASSLSALTSELSWHSSTLRS